MATNEPEMTVPVKDVAREDFGRLENVCTTMLKLADEIESLEKRVHHIATDLKGRSETHTDMRKYLWSTNRGGRKSKQLHDKPFHGLTKIEQSDGQQKIYNLRMDLVMKFEALRKVQIASQKSKTIRGALGTEKSSLSPDPVEVNYLKEMMDEQLELSKDILNIEQERIDLTLSAVADKTRITELHQKANNEVQDMEEDDKESENEEANENAATDVEDDHPEEIAIKQKTRKLKVEEAKVNQMRHLILKLMFSLPNNSMNFDDLVNKEHEDMMNWCTQEPSDMRGGRRK